MTTPTREQVDVWQRESGFSVDKFVTLTRADLEATVAEQAKEIEALHTELAISDRRGNVFSEDCSKLRQQLTSAQATNRALRDLMEEATTYTSCPLWSPSLTQEIYNAIALPADDSALNAALDAEREAVIALLLKLGALGDGDFVAAIRARKEKA